MDLSNVRFPLRRAHFFERAAEQFEEDNKFDEAVLCHDKTIELLEKSLKISTFSITQESIQLQIEYHQRHEKILKLKKLHHTVQQKLLVEKDRLMELAQKEVDHRENNETLQWAIYQKIDEADSLIEFLNKRESKLANETIELGTSPSYNSATKHPKNDNTVIEELHTLNNGLRALITQLLGELEESHKEVAVLREKIKYYESIYPKKGDFEEQNLIDFSSICSSVESIGIIS